jgi:hypothetical protein
MLKESTLIRNSIKIQPDPIKPEINKNENDFENGGYNKNEINDKGQTIELPNNLRPGHGHWLSKRKRYRTNVTIIFLKS